MYKLRFFIGLPFFQERTQIGEADSMQDCPYKALEEARPKAKAVEKAIDEAFAVKPGQGKIPLDPARVEIGVYQDSGQLALLDVPKKQQVKVPPKEKPWWEPTGDYFGCVELKVNNQPVQIATMEFPSTSAALALGRSVTAARNLIDQLRSDPAMKPVKKFITFKNVTVTVERVHDTISFLSDEDSQRDWSSLSFPAPRF